MTGEPEIMHSRIKITVGLLGAALLATGFCWGTYFGQETYEPKVFTVEVPVEKIRVVNHYTDVPVEVMKEVDVIVETPILLREFASLTELKTWLDKDQTDGRHIIFSWDSGEISLDGESSPNVWEDPNFRDCDDYAVILQQEAANDGFLVNVQLDSKKMHALNSVFIGNDVYFVEPQTDKVWFAYHRDAE